MNVIALNRGGFYETMLRDAQIPVTVLQKRFRFDPLTYVRLRRHLIATAPDVVQSFLFSANAYVRLPGVCPAKTKIVVSVRCVDSWKSGWQLKMDRWQSRRMHMMTANSASVADFYQRTANVPADKICIIPNGVPQPATNPKIANGTPNIRQQLNLPDDTPIVGFAGRLAPQKRLLDLVWAFHLLHQTVDKVVLVIVGDGPERESLGEFAASVGCRERVFFMGRREDAADIVGQFDAFCLPSSFEGMSNSLMEAMAAGVPAVVSDIPANKELIVHEETGLVVPLGESADICRALKRLLVETEFSQQLAKNAAEKVQTELSVTQMVRKHVELYERI